VLHAFIIAIEYSLERHHLDTIMSASPVSAWLNAAAKFPLLTKEEEIVLGRQVVDWKALPTDACDPEHERIKRNGIRAQQRLTEANLRLVWKLVRERYGTSLGTDDLLDLLQCGSLGLHHAASKYNPELGYRFTTYARDWILEKCQRWQDNCSRPIRIPTTLTNTARRLSKVRRELNVRLGREPSLSELASGLGKSPDEVRLLIERMMPVSSLDQPLHSSVDCTLAETIPAPTSGWNDAERHELKIRLQLLSQHRIARVTPISEAHQLDLVLG
jgi:RNA polymerase sigma factor (sigma-70 family)